jgi:hypothetical protein
VHLLEISLQIIVWWLREIARGGGSKIDFVFIFLLNIKIYDNSKFISKPKVNRATPTVSFDKNKC